MPDLAASVSVRFSNRLTRSLGRADATTGRIALAYMRTRATGSGGDFARTERQRKVVAQLFDKCRSLSLLELVGLYNEVSSGMKMSLSAMDILSVLSQGYTLMTSGALPDNGGSGSGGNDDGGAGEDLVHRSSLSWRACFSYG